MALMKTCENELSRNKPPVHGVCSPLLTIVVTTHSTCWYGRHVTDKIAPVWLCRNQMKVANWRLNCTLKIFSAQMSKFLLWQLFVDVLSVCGLLWNFIWGGFKICGAHVSVQCCDIWSKMWLKYLGHFCGLLWLCPVADPGFVQGGPSSGLPDLADVSERSRSSEASISRHGVWGLP